MRRNKKINNSDTPLFDEAGYLAILASLDAQFKKLQEFQNETLAERAAARVAFENEQRKRDAEGTKMLQSIKTPKLPSIRKKPAAKAKTTPKSK
jgi:hypothetical protein